MTGLEATNLIVQMVTVLILGWFIKSYLPSYFSEKGKNLATKEDIGKITAEVEKVRLVHSSALEVTKNALQESLEAMKHELAIALESNRQYQTLKQQAYVDFIGGVAGIAMAQRHNDQIRELEASILLAAAKARIAVYGNKDVLESVGEFFERYGALTNRDAMLAFLDAIDKMRRNSTTRDQWVSKSSIGQLLFSASIPE